MGIEMKGKLMKKHQNEVINKIIRVILPMSLCAVLMICSSLCIYASNTPAYGGKITRGVSNVTIYLDYNSGMANWENYVVKAADNWVDPGSGMTNPIKITFVSSNSASTMDFYSKSSSFWSSSGSTTVLAETRMFSKGTRIYPSASSTTTWNYAEIYINDTNFRLSSFSNEQALGTVIHEMGHAFGLAHYNTNVNSIMCQTSYGRAVQRVQKCDNDAINAKYN